RLHAGTRRQILAARPGAPCDVDLIAIADVRHPDRGGDNLALIGATQTEQTIDLLQDLLRLAFRILARIVGHDARGENKAVGLNDIRENLGRLVAYDGHAHLPSVRLDQRLLARFAA